MKPIKQKKCKARGCNNTFKPFNTIQNWCSPECGLSIAKDKQWKEFDKDTKRRKKKLLEDDLPAQKALTKTAVNKLVLKRDIGKPCISCGTDKQNIKYDAGHYKTVGSCPELRYNLKNINRQCSNYCNVNHSGNINGAHDSKGQRVGIVERFGQERLDYLEGPHERIKYTCLDLIEFRKEVNQIIRDIENGLPFREPSMYQEN